MPASDGEGPHDSRRRFHHRNEAFLCGQCGRNVPPSRKTCRDHCPYCLTSQHVDEFPGDRQSSCGGLMDAVDYELSGKKGLVLIYRCRVCGHRHKNMATLEDEDTPDDYDRILQLKG